MREEAGGGNRRGQRRELMSKKILQAGYYKLEEQKLIRLRRQCPKCGPGFWLALHAGRASCGRCGYTEFKKA